MREILPSAANSPRTRPSTPETTVNWTVIKVPSAKNCAFDPIGSGANAMTLAATQRAATRINESITMEAWLRCLRVQRWGHPIRKVAMLSA